MKSYWPAIFLSLSGHALLVWLVVWGWTQAAPKIEVKKPSYIKASLVQLEEKAKPAPKPVKPKPPTPRKQDNKKAEQKKQQEKKLAEQKRQQKVEAERKKQLAKKQAEAKAAALRQKKEQERLAREKKQKEQEQQRKQELLKELEQERQRELQRAIEQEKARIKAQQQAAEDEALAQSFNDIINARVSENWSRPPSARNGMVVLLRIQLIPTGEVIGVEVTRSSGDSAFDRSAEQAVRKAERFSELRELPGHVFEKYFRTFNLIFEPQDLRQ